MPADRNDTANSDYEVVSRQIDFLVGLAQAELPKLTDQEAKTQVTRALEHIEARREDMLLILSRRGKHSRHTAPWYAFACFGQLFHAALIIGIYCSIPDSSRTHIHSGRMRIARASKDQGSAEINEIIREKAEGLWGRRPNFRNNMQGTAEIIREDVLDRVRQKICEGEIPEEKAKPLSVGAIRRRLERMRRGRLIAVQDN